MEINYEILKEEILSILKNNTHWTLSTSSNDSVTSRTISIINDDLNIYFQTNKCYTKYFQIKQNNNISLCLNNVSIEGIAEEIGDWKDEKNSKLLELYKSIHPNSFDYYGLLDGQVIYKISPSKIKLWKYINGKPLREFLYPNRALAEQLDFM